MEIIMISEAVALVITCLVIRFTLPNQKKPGLFDPVDFRR